MNIDFEKVVTNAVSALVATVFVGAAVVVWNAATTIDSRIDNANAGLEVANTMLNKQQAALLATQDTIVEQITENSAELKLLAASVRDVLQRLADSSPEDTPNNPLAVELPNVNLNDLGELEIWKSAQQARLKQGIDVRQSENLSKYSSKRGD